MTPQIYFWKDGEVLVFAENELHGEDDWFFGVECVDTRFPAGSRSRYGKFTENGWQSTQVTNLNPEFRAHLLLLGVS